METSLEMTSIDILGKDKSQLKLQIKESKHVAADSSQSPFGPLVNAGRLQFLIP